ncbi:MAG TPA: TetR/AcrR family transcriptional regulator [Terracidiphilus sp.]|jgi:AcrR family transcriptional regulator|nr:TetR/AcrR family transcriptional regulator [Terracidiphilus sp.]
MTGKSDKREAILKAMLDLVVERGFHDAPMSLLAKRSGASPGVIYHYFPSKDELIRAVYERVASIKHEVFFEGVSADEPPREALLQVWLNAYRFYRTHLKETRFLDQYLNSPYCRIDAEAEAQSATPETARILKWLRPKKKGGILKDLPPEAIDALTLGLAARLAKAPKPFPAATLKKIADTVWQAIADE